jgi:hypothetical protein
MDSPWTVEKWRQDMMIRVCSGRGIPWTVWQVFGLDRFRYGIGMAYFSTTDDMSASDAERVLRKAIVAERFSRRLGPVPGLQLALKWLRERQ